MNPHSPSPAEATLDYGRVGHDPPVPHDPGPRTLGLRDVLALTAVSLLVLVPGTIGVSLIDRDEGWYAQVCREMLASGDWIVPRYLGEVWIAKPPLTYWFVNISFLLFGFGEWQARLVPVLASTVNVLLAAQLAARMFNRRIGLLAGVVFITLGLPIVVGKMLLTDALMLTCTLAAVLLHWRMTEPGGMTHRRIAGYWLAIGLGILAKGPATLLFAGVFGIALLFAPGRRRWLFDWRASTSFIRSLVTALRWWWWFPLALLVAVPWYLHMALIAGDVLVEQFLWYEILDRFKGDPHGHGGPPGYHVMVGLGGMLPWLFFVPGTLIEAFHRWREDAATRILLVWLIVPWIILELVRSKLPHYVLPCYVPLAMLMAYSFDAGIRARRGWPDLPRVEQRILDAWVHFMIGLGVVGTVGSLLLWHPTLTPAGCATAATLVIGFALVRRRLRARPGGAADATHADPASSRSGFDDLKAPLKGSPFGRAFTAAVCTAVAFHLVAGFWLLPALEPLRLSRQLAERINTIAAPDERVYFVGYDEPTVYYYLENNGRPLKRDELYDLLGPDKGSFVLAVTEQSIDRMNPDLVESVTSLPHEADIEGFNYVKMKTEAIRILRHLDRSQAVPE